MMDPNQAAPMGAPGAAAPAGAAPGAVVCIATQPDGTFMVYQADQDPQAGQACQDVDQALEAAETMLTGSSDDDAAGSSATAQAADEMFSQGFKGVRSPLNRGDGDHEYR